MLQKVMAYMQWLISGGTRWNSVPVPLFEIEQKIFYIIRLHTKCSTVHSYRTDDHSDQTMQMCNDIERLKYTRRCVLLMPRKFGRINRNQR